ncbi:LPXTG cell wall anchor domain-containing protein [Nocardioides sp. LMS-CY]|uniref:neocarzinostatin apoprotein domain-containing protein n=1 Tax=Nocardioides sp. (strain LMS-CY) TaxID=2840457 RepID=UPI001C0038F8|nr:neocarzinostatin apoprotein domain-containing protein [Nocardioides sp. LMS-CY]QWF23295.1 LPXTG cell wall anchor domain-containing protein [Nocardioides sp. LMS-CY]
MTMYTPGRKGRARGKTRRGRLLAAFTATVALAVMPALAVVSPASAAPKGTLAAVSGTTAGLTPGQSVDLTLTNYPAENVLVKYCELVMVGFSMTVGDCAASPVNVTVPDTAGGRGNATATAVAQKMIGAKDCAAAAMCGFVTESAGVTKNPDSDVKLTVAFDTPELEILDRAPTAADNSPVTVKGTGFRPNTTMRLTQCNNSLPAGGKCRSTLGQGYAEPTTDANGEFETELNVSASYVSGADTLNCTDGSIVCGVQTSSKVSGADRTQQAMVDLDFGGTLTASKVTGISTAGESITATGTGFQPNIDLYLVNCDTAVPAGGACDMARLEEVHTDANGGFSQAITVGSFTGTDCLVKACGLQTSKVGAGADMSQTATLPLSFTAPPVHTAALTASKTSGLSAAGESITANGTGFQPNINLFLALCDTAVPAGGACDMTNFKQVTTNGSGAFSQAIKVGSFTGTDCLVKACGLQTSKVGAGADASQTATLPLSFVNTPPAPTATLSASKTTGISMSGEDLQVNGSGFKPNVSLFLALCNTKVPAGGACDMANFKQVKTDGSGAFPKTSIKVVGSFTGGNGSKVDCLSDPCALQTSQVGAGSDATQTATLPLGFVKGSATGSKAALNAPKVVKSGSTVKVKGSGFKAGTKVQTALCKTSAKVGKQCWTAKAKTAKVKKNGTFTAKIKVAKKFQSKQGKVNCGKSKCAIKTWNKKKPKQASSQVTHKVKFGNKTARTTTIVSTSTALSPTFAVRAARAGESLSVSKTSGLSPAGETVSVKGSGFNPKVGLFIALCNTDVPAGGACDMSNFKQVQTDANGAFPATSIKVVGTFTGGDGSKVDCSSDPCALQTSQVGSGADGQATVPLTFGGTSSGGDSGGDSGDDGASGGDSGGNDSGDDGATSSGGTSANGSSSSGGGAVLPQTGAGDELWLATVGLLMLVGGLALTLRRSARAS